MSKAPTPIAVALLLCDQLIVDQRTSKLTLVGVFDRFRVPTFPSPPREVHAFVSLVDSVGQVEVRLVCVDDDNTEIYSMQGTASFPDRLTIVNLSFVAKNLQFHQPGIYFIQLYCDDVIVAERKVTVYKAED